MEKKKRKKKQGEPNSAGGNGPLIKQTFQVPHLNPIYFIFNAPEIVSGVKLLLVPFSFKNSGIICCLPFEVK